MIAGALTVPVILQMIQELLRQRYYGGVVIDTRAQPVNVTSDPRIPANMVFVITSDGKTVEYTSSQIGADVLRSFLGKK